MGPEAFVFTDQESEEQRQQPLDDEAYRAYAEQPDASTPDIREPEPTSAEPLRSDSASPETASTPDHKNQVYTAEDLQRARDGACPYLAALAMSDFEREKRSAERRERVAAERARIKAEKLAEAASKSEATSETIVDVNATKDKQPAAQAAQTAETAANTTRANAVKPPEKPAEEQQPLPDETALPPKQQTATANRAQPETNPDIVLAELERHYNHDPANPTESIPATTEATTTQAATQVAAVLERLIAEQQAEQQLHATRTQQAGQEPEIRADRRGETTRQEANVDVAQSRETTVPSQESIEPTAQPASLLKRAIARMRHPAAPGLPVQQTAVELMPISKPDMEPSTLDTYEDGVSDAPYAEPATVYTAAADTIEQPVTEPLHPLEQPFNPLEIPVIEAPAPALSTPSETTPAALEHASALAELSERIGQQLETLPAEAAEQATSVLEQLAGLAEQVADGSLEVTAFEHICNQNLRRAGIHLQVSELELVSSRLIRRAHQTSPNDMVSPLNDTPANRYDDGMHEAKNQALWMWQQLTGQPTATGSHSANPHTLGRYAVLWHSLTRHRSPIADRSPG